MLGGLMGGGGLAQPQRVYTSGTRLEELLSWSSVEATEALYLYILQMEGEEQEVFFNTLPRVAECLTGLDNSTHAWLNDQASLLRDPGRNVRLAQQIDQKVCALLLPQSGFASAPSATAVGGMPSIGMGGMLGRNTKSTYKRSGLLFEKLIDGRVAMSYTFLANGGINYRLPHAVCLALTQGHYATQNPSGVRLIPEFFLNRLQMQACCSPQRGFLCMANDSGLLQLHAQTQHLEAVSLPSTSHIRLVAGATTQLGGTITNAQSPFDSRGTWLDRSCVISFVVAGVAGKVGFGGHTAEKPLYFRLLKGYLNYFMPIGGAKHAAASDFVEAMAQFWLCQNPSPAASAILSGITFQPTSAAVLKCLEVLVMHVNEHEKHRVETRAAEAHSCHILLRTAMYHFFKSQLEGLPDISARVAMLIRLLVLYLQPWGEPAARKVVAGNAEPGATNTPAISNSTPQAIVPAELHAIVTACSARAAGHWLASHRMTSCPAGSENGVWEWSLFVQRNYLLYVRLLTCVANETVSGRFNLNEKRECACDVARLAFLGPPLCASVTESCRPAWLSRCSPLVQMLNAVAALFETPQLLPLMRSMSQAIEGLYHGSLSPSSPYHGILFEQLEALEEIIEGRHKACEASMPNAIYRDLDAMDKKLQASSRRRMAMADGIRARNPSLAFESPQVGASSIQLTIESLRRSVQHALRELLPPGREIQREEKASQARVEVLMLSGLTPLSTEERRALLHGGARCSALKVPYRATPRLPVRPVSSFEIRWLVELSERLAPKMPHALLQTGFHPRLLASWHALVLLAAHAVLLCMPIARGVPEREVANTLTSLLNSAHAHDESSALVERMIKEAKRRTCH
ncbi:MAG: hypothetical protein SGPRY_005580 [Prymnesium sp.]